MKNNAFINVKILLNLVGILLMTLGGMLLLPVAISWYYQSGDGQAFLISGLGTGLLGLLLWYTQRTDNQTFYKREGYLIVALGWLSMIFIGSLPYVLSGSTTNYTDALFESVSGFTTTGATVFQDIPSLSEGILFWRSLTQWIGGMGIIVLTVALFPLLGIGGFELFAAEAPGPSAEKLHPRIRETAKRFWFIYLGLTIILILLYRLFGMGNFDAVNHALTTMATGGFSTKNESMAYWNHIPMIQYTAIFFMFLAGTNYAILYFGFKGKLKSIWQSTEFRTYLLGVIGLALIITTTIYFSRDYALEESFRAGLFHVISFTTTTGFVTQNYLTWPMVLIMLTMLMLVLGASAGSTSGGIKVIRHLVLYKNIFLEFKRILHPKAVIPLKIDGRVVDTHVLARILVFLLAYLFFIALGAMVLAALDMDLITAIGASATAMGNVGPAVGELGPLDNFSQVPSAGKWFLCFQMLLGRLELFTILVILTPNFWRTK